MTASSVIPASLQENIPWWTVKWYRRISMNIQKAIYCVKYNNKRFLQSITINANNNRQTKKRTYICQFSICYSMLDEMPEREQSHRIHKTTKEHLWNCYNVLTLHMKHIKQSTRTINQQTTKIVTTSHMLDKIPEWEIPAETAHKPTRRTREIIHTRADLRQEEVPGKVARDRGWTAEEGRYRERSRRGASGGYRKACLACGERKRP